METIKRFLIFILAGALTGGMLAAWVAPHFVAWYQTPGGSTPALCNCKELIHETANMLNQAQVIGVIGGAMFGLFIGIVFRKRTKTNTGVNPANSAPLQKS